ncbi:MAG: DUF4296 domain-containing protein [Flavisolibacter sp.]|jgi:hypothetical protein|nr:DUF4296 domain-containing protein [Flavisolibacter sp.]
MKAVFIFLTFILIFSCSGNSGVPRGVMNPSKMEAVLWDMLRAEELAQHQFLKDSTIAAFHRHSALYDKVFEVHEIEKRYFQKSFKFYQSRPDLLKPIFETLHQRSEKLVEAKNSD